MEKTKYDRNEQKLRTVVRPKQILLNPIIGQQRKIMFCDIGQGKNCSGSESEEEKRIQIINEGNCATSDQSTEPNGLPFPELNKSQTQSADYISENGVETSIRFCCVDGGRETVIEDTVRDQDADKQAQIAAAYVGTGGMDNHESASKRPKDVRNFNAAGVYSEKSGKVNVSFRRKFNTEDADTVRISESYREREPERTGIGEDVGKKKNYPNNSSGKRYPGDDLWEVHSRLSPKCPDLKQNNLQEFKERKTSVQRENCSDSESDKENRIQTKKEENVMLFTVLNESQAQSSNYTSENDVESSKSFCCDDAREPLIGDNVRDQDADNQALTSNFKAAANVLTGGMGNHESASKQPKDVRNFNAAGAFSEKAGKENVSFRRKFNTEDADIVCVSESYREREHEKTGIGDDVGERKKYKKNSSGNDAEICEKNLWKRYPVDDPREEHAKLSRICSDLKQNNLQEFENRQQRGRDTRNDAQDGQGRLLARNRSSCGYSETNNGSRVSPEATLRQAAPDLYDLESDMDQSRALNDLTSREDTLARRANYGQRTEVRSHGSEERAAFDSRADVKTNGVPEFDPRNENDIRGAEGGTDDYHGGGLRQPSSSAQLRGNTSIQLSQSVTLENQDGHVPPRGRGDFGAEGGTDDYHGGGLRQPSSSTQLRGNTSIQLSQSVTLENQGRYVPPRGRRDFVYNGEYLSLRNVEELGTRQTVYSGRVTRYIHSREVDERYHLGCPVCCICNQRIATRILLPCGHSLCCTNCARFQHFCVECGKTICDIARM